MAGDDLRHHLALRRRPVGEHRLAGHVADRIDPAHGGAASLVDADRPSLHVEIDLLEPPARGRRLAPDRDQDLVGRDLAFATVFGLDGELAVLSRQSLGPGAGDDLDPEFVEMPNDGLSQLPVVER